MVTADKAKQLVALHGDVRSQLSADWTGTLALPAAVARFYRDVGPANVTIRSYGNSYYLPALAHLWRFQAGYRWNVLNGALIEDWNDDWLVVADEGGDPFIFSRPSGVVLHANHGEGAWNPNEMFPDLNTMAAALALLGAVVLEAGKDFLDADHSIRPEFRGLAADRLGQLLGSRSAAENVLRWLWE